MHGLTDAEIMAALRARGVPEKRIDRWLASTSITRHAEATKGRSHSQTRIRRENGVAPPCTSGKRHRDTRSEAQIQREIVNALKAAGWTVWRIGQRDARKTQDPGVPDLYAMRPWALGYGTALAVWIECKRADGKQSDAQKDFERLCEHAGKRYILARSLNDIKELL